MGLDQPANYHLADEPLPAQSPRIAESIVTQALGNRPELAGLRFSRDAAYKFADAENDLTAHGQRGRRRRIPSVYRFARTFQTSTKRSPPTSAFRFSTGIFFGAA